jgi:hypothetical protein
MSAWNRARTANPDQGAALAGALRRQASAKRARPLLQGVMATFSTPSRW